MTTKEIMLPHRYSRFELEGISLFTDGNKEEYPKIFEVLLKMLKDGTAIFTETNIFTEEESREIEYSIDWGSSDKKTYFDFVDLIKEDEIGNPVEKAIALLDENLISVSRDWKLNNTSYLSIERGKMDANIQKIYWNSIDVGYKNIEIQKNPEDPKFIDELVRLLKEISPKSYSAVELVTADITPKIMIAQPFDFLYVNILSDDDLVYPFSGDCPSIGPDVLAELLSNTNSTIRQIIYEVTDKDNEFLDLTAGNIICTVTLLLEQSAWFRKWQDANKDY